jgi:hypothetical protein
MKPVRPPSRKFSPNPLARRLVPLLFGLLSFLLLATIALITAAMLGWFPPGK